MPAPESQSREGRSSQEGQAPRRVAEAGGLGSPRNTLILIVPILVVLITFLFWYQTWFGRPLGEREMSQYLSDTSVPHKTQHALVQLSDRVARGDGTARRWYPEIIALAQNKEPQLRSMAAWVMGQDNHCEEFHHTLRKLVDDPAPLVRWNAALALARFADAAGEPQLWEMLQPFTLAAPQAGTLKFCLKEQDAVQSGGIVARIASVGHANSVDVLSPMAGKVVRLAAKEGGQVGAGEAIAVIEPGEAQVFEALRALVLVGQPETLADVERFAAGVPGMSERVRHQALLTAQAIRLKVRQKGKAE
jgi:HEAT repeat protein